MAESLSDFIKKGLRAKFKKKRLTKLQEKAADDLCESIVCSTEVDRWESTAEACIVDNEKISNLPTRPEILDISQEKIFLFIRLHCFTTASGGQRMIKNVIVESDYTEIVTAPVGSGYANWVFIFVTRLMMTML